MSFEINCTAERKNLGLLELCQDLGLPIGYILTNKGVEFDTETDAQTLTNWVAEIVSKDVYPSPRIKSSEDVKEETIYDDTPTGEDFVRHGKQRFRFMHSTNSKLHSKLWTHARKGGGIFLIFENAATIRIAGYTPDGTKVRPFTLELFQPEKLGLNDGATVTTSSVYVVLRNALEYNRDIVTIEPDFDFDELNSLIDVNVTQAGATAPSATTARIFVKDDNSGVDISGLVAGDFATLSGTTYTDVTSATENTDGSYTVVYGTLANGTHIIGLKLPGDMTTQSPQGYEQLNGLSVTIS